MKIHSVPADGDCFYHAFIKGLGLEGITPQYLRDFVAEKILSDKDLYEDLVTEWIDFGLVNNRASINPQIAAKRTSQTKEWATSTTIHVIAKAFNVRVVVFQQINGKFFSEIFPSEWKDERKPSVTPYKDIYLFRRGYHFDLLIPLEKNGDPSDKKKKDAENNISFIRGGGQEPRTGMNIFLGVLGVAIFIWTF